MAAMNMVFAKGISKQTAQCSFTWQRPRNRNSFPFLALQIRSTGAP